MFLFTVRDMIKAVIFDIDGVLIDTFEANLKFFQDLVIANGYIPPTREEYKKFYHMTRIDAIRAMTGTEDEQIISKIFETSTSGEIRYPTELIVVPKQMKETIAKLAQDYSLSIVTNKIRQGIFLSEDMQQIKDFFGHIIAFEDIKKPKPDPEALLSILQKLHIKPQEAVYIWDSKTDFQAAQAANVPFILFSKNEMERITYHTDNFEKLPEIIKQVTN